MLKDPQKEQLVQKEVDKSYKYTLHISMGVNWFIYIWDGFWNFLCMWNKCHFHKIWQSKNYGDISYMRDTNILTTLRQETVLTIEMK